MLDTTIKETLYRAITASITTCRVLADTEVLGYCIRKGSNVLLNLRIDKKPFNVDERRRSATSQAAQAKHWRGGFDSPSGQHLDTFEPRRWLALDPTTGKEVFDAYALPSLTFGGGLRGCFGKRLAMLELRIIISTLMLNFEFLPLREEMSGLEAEEEVFRKPKTAFVKLWARDRASEARAIVAFGRVRETEGQSSRCILLYYYRRANPEHLAVFFTLVKPPLDSSMPASPLSGQRPWRGGLVATDTAQGFSAPYQLADSGGRVEDIRMRVFFDGLAARGLCQRTLRVNYQDLPY
ncbi:hypothetical protein B0T14DRAFT_601066 [Immersiella caudata]|uniref:Cytochrome P450 n=1 Tax=Immersiella caudata TaxID=314043 RepID=A0AA39X610_9PEZI|nr:hypothetical protein B0T14DRAFT_601066 [Immersiella caudata]